ncbi:ParB/Srx family N-terminal domain-containing protein [Nocardia yamanashiensis]|uniref:ParB/Srx family N-terminal domain-containing protein n=1 Tax=Nocardia yamanashiensis TaxID=209247 RepID=UPI0008317474|nr:ParB/Srx family N-terminal domain-containing protein [Nocardia yamanashiensis]
MTTTETPTPDIGEAADPVPALDSPAEEQPGADTLEPTRLTAEQITDLRARLEASETGRVSLLWNPNDLVFGRNIRKHATATINREYVQRILDNKDVFEQDPTVWINPDGYLQVKDGQRRTLGSRAAGLTAIPVILRYPPEGDTEKQQRVSEIGGQLTANEDHEALTAPDKFDAVTELLDLGVSVTKVARVTPGMNTRDVKAIKAIRRAKTTAPMDLAVDGQLTLEQSAALIEFEDDPQAVATLTDAARKGQFDYVATALRNKRESDAAYAEAAAVVEAEGFTVLYHEPKWNERDTYVSSNRLHGPDGTAFDPATITEPKHWAVWLDDYEKYFVREDGREVPEHAIDWDTQDNPDQPPHEGLYAVADIRVEQVWLRHHYCIDVPATGLTDPRATPAPSPDSPEALAAAEAQAQQQRAERAKTKAMNKAARAATPKRRQWVTGLVAGAKVPKGAHVFRSKLEASEPSIICEQAAPYITAGLLNMDRDKLINGSAFDAATENRAAVIGVAIACGAIEARMHPNLGDKNNERPDWWRRTSVNTYRDGIAIFSHYLAFLKANGYPLTPIERYTLGEIDEATFYTEEAELTGDTL